MKEIKIMSSSKKVIITGASGLIGKEIITPLKEAGFDIYALTIDVNNPVIEGVTWVPCNIFDNKKTKEIFNYIKPQYLIHLAWVVTENYITSNLNFDFLKSSLGLLKFFHDAGGKRAVFTGTCLEYGQKAIPLKENDTIEPLGIYGKCKNYLREIAEIYCTNNNISFAWGRIFYVYGKGEHPKRLTASIINSLKENKPIQVNHAQLHRDYIYTKDIAGALTELLKSDINGIVNICSGKSISIGEYTEKIAKKLGKEDLLILKELPTPQPAKIIGNNTRLTEEVKYKIKYDIDIALDEILHN
ncbi:MAG: NAD(P)-dependent oxidoreductase [Elusimicrobiota bacterium]|jgi:nucleoside-diphosphate-sugar epimerase|nr:NAD(P)-dependent oxidoreductase [Elusimicrobiota bacterium]